MRGPIKAYISPYFTDYPTVIEGGQYPTETLLPEQPGSTLKHSRECLSCSPFPLQNPKVDPANHESVGFRGYGLRGSPFLRALRRPVSQELRARVPQMRSPDCKREFPEICGVLSWGVLIGRIMLSWGFDWGLHVLRPLNMRVRNAGDMG